MLADGDYDMQSISEIPDDKKRDFEDEDRKTKSPGDTTDEEGGSGLEEEEEEEDLREMYISF